MAITSQLRSSTPFDVVLDDWRAAGLLKPSAIKPVITTVANSRVRKPLGTLTARDQQRLREVLGKIVG